MLQGRQGSHGHVDQRHCEQHGRQHLFSDCKCDASSLRSEDVVASSLCEGGCSFAVVPRRARGVPRAPEHLSIFLSIFRRGIK